VRFIFNGFYKYLKTNDWSTGEDITHQMLKKMKGIGREKFHIEENVKKWVYVLDIEEFKNKEIEHEDIDFGQEESAPY